MATGMLAACACLALLLACPAVAHRGRRAPNVQTSSLRSASLAALPAHQHYAADCWKLRSLRRIALTSETARTEEEKLPGAGMNPESIEAFKVVLKDGFLGIACAKDYLLNFGDKFGDGKDSYKLGEVSNVSIVHYTSIVPKEDRKAMTQEVCFEFCRTVPDMLTFGIHNGRDCYCSPYFKPMESDSTNCDAVCEGNPTQMCGGKFKSSVFEMHMCADSAAELKTARQRASDAASELGDLIGHVQTLSQDMQTGATALQEVFGQLGDPAASNLTQTAKAYAGVLNNSVVTKGKIATALTHAISAAQDLQGASFTNATVANEAEALTRKLAKLHDAAEDATEELTTQSRESSPTLNASANATQQYYPLMYFVDKVYQDVPTTCTGTPVSNPLTSISLDECAQACDAQIHSCVGFDYFSAAPTLCFLFSKFAEATYYTGCNSTAFLQNRELSKSASSTTLSSCMAKLSKVDGTTLKPDPSGKCDGCLKSATAADRCPQL